jgi:hypothetical protein
MILCLQGLAREWGSAVASSSSLGKYRLACILLLHVLRLGVAGPILITPVTELAQNCKLLWSFLPDLARLCIRISVLKLSTCRLGKWATIQTPLIVAHVW